MPDLCTKCKLKLRSNAVLHTCLQCFNTVGRTSGRASGL